MNMKPKGFKFATAEAAIKKPGRNDLALVFSERPADASALFTRNAVKAAPLLISMERIRSGKAQAILVNSGNANACTGSQGIEAAAETSALAARLLGIPEEMVQVASTGVIGVQLPAERVLSAIPALVGSLPDGTLEDVARAIMTTDTFPKLETVEFEAGGMRCAIAGIAKGAGMIMPDMATMLSFVLSDVNVDPLFLDKAFRRSVDSSFNAITVDGDMSTNDTTLIMANGMAGNSIILEGTPEGARFESALRGVLISLARKIVKDGEGATKFAEIRVIGAESDPDAKKVAMAIANSTLVKTAFFGEDANWGRVFAAAGYSGAMVDQNRLSLWFDDVCMARDGVFAGGDAEARGTGVLRKEEFRVTLDMGLGSGEATVYTSDLSHEYISINADYRT